MKHQVFTLKNGLRIVHVPCDGEVAHCGLVINAGSRDEDEHLQGIAHFIEHMIFKGTKKRKAFHILSRLDVVGGELNAYTSKEETCIYASFVKKHYERAIELLADITFNPVFPEKEIKKERDVIADEIHSYEDSPAEQIFDDFEEQLFHGHPISRNILGTIESLNSIKKKHLSDFVSKHYCTNKMVFSSVGNIPPDELLKLCEKYFGSLSPRASSYSRKSFKNYFPSYREVKKNTSLVHTFIGNIAYNATDKRRAGLVLLNNILGGPAMNSRLNLNIREKYGFAYTIESLYSAYTDTGVFGIYAATDKNNSAKCVKLIKNELKKLRDKKLGTVQLHQAKQQLVGHLALSQENRSNVMLALGKSLSLYDKIDTLAQIHQKIEKVSDNQLLEIANDIFDEKKLSSLTYV